VATHVFKKLEPHFEKSMIVLYTDGEMKPWKWTPTWALQGPPLPIDLSTPSIFRIAYLSKNPFHGEPVTNPINKAFFDQWNAGALPSHITICPLLVSDSPTGMLLGVTSKPTNTVSLPTVERLASEVSDLLVKYSAKKAA
jgi:hypothetical protein